MVSTDCRDFSFAKEEGKHMYTTIARQHESEHNQTVACRR